MDNWSGKRDSNSRPRPWQGRALPAELFPRLKIQCKNLVRGFYLSAAVRQPFLSFLYGENGVSIIFEFFYRFSYIIKC